MIGKEKKRFSVTFSKKHYELLEEIERDTGRTKSELLEAAFCLMLCTAGTMGKAAAATIDNNTKAE